MGGHAGPSGALAPAGSNRSRALVGLARGLLGAIYAMVTVVLARHVDAGTLIALVVAGQLICSVLVDHFGVLGFDPRPLSLARAAGCGLMVGGFVLIWKF